MGLRRVWKKTKMSARAFYFNPAKPSAFWTVNKLSPVYSRKNKSHVRAWLEQQEAYTKHRPVRESIMRNTYIVSNLIDVWECGLLDVVPRKIQLYADTFLGK